MMMSCGRGVRAHLREEQFTKQLRQVQPQTSDKGLKRLQQQRRFRLGALGNNSNNQEFNFEDYVEATVANVNSNGKQYKVHLRLNDGRTSELPIYIGDSEFQSLSKVLKNIPQGRPLTHDLFQTVLEELGFRVTKVLITELVSNTYYARVFISKKGLQNFLDQTQLSFDARPSDAIGLAYRFDATILVNKSLVNEMVVQQTTRAKYSYDYDHQRELLSCYHAEVVEYADPVFILDLERDIAIKENRFEDAIKKQQQKDEIIKKDKILSLMCAMESALMNGRLDEAGILHDKIRELRKTQDEELFQSHDSDSEQF